MSKIQASGFGFIPEETKHHFLLRIPRSKNNEVVVYERFEWDDCEEQKSEINEKNLKVMISREKWDAINDFIQKEFNKRLTARNTLVGKFKTGDNPIERLLGKELILLLWAIEDSDPSLIHTAIKNWLGLSQEERWWLFTMSNATTGNYADKRGWRKAIRYALTENPVDEAGIQGNIAEYLYKQL
jgi:hypothetical protein